VLVAEDPEFEEEDWIEPAPSIGRELAVLCSVLSFTEVAGMSLTSYGDTCARKSSRQTSGH